jgi:hypothetical protein
MTPIIDEYTDYEFTEAELKEARIFTPLQKAYISSEIARACREKMELKVDVNNIMAFVQAEAELQGNINSLKFLITTDVPAPTKADVPPAKD